MRPAKKERRLYYRQLQASFPPSQYLYWNENLGANLQKVATKLQKGSHVAVYQARPKEASLQPLFNLPFRFCFPKVISRKGGMEFRWVQNAAESREFAEGEFGILEPKKIHPVIDKKEMSACFVPMLAFDSEGKRLGQGLGFYDRFLHEFPGLKIGVAFEWQRSPEPLPIEGHDKDLDLIVTECEIRSFR